MGRRALLSLTTIGVAVLLSSGVALAANLVTCTGGLCEGTTGDDEMVGTRDTDYIYAYEGNDTLRGGRNFDDLRGGPGNDNLNGGRGNDQYNIYDNNWGADTISADRSGVKDWLIFQTSGALMIDLKPNSTSDEVSSGTNTITFAPEVVIEWVQAGSESDTIKGNGADNYLSGAGKDDTLNGRNGDDNLLGDIVVFGNNGNDTLIGGPGNDDLDGGPGNDVFFAQDGEADEITCGPGADVVHADRSLDSLSLDCIDFVHP